MWLLPSPPRGGRWPHRLLCAFSVDGTNVGSLISTRPEVSLLPGAFSFTNKTPELLSRGARDSPEGGEEDPGSSVVSRAQARAGGGGRGVRPVFSAAPAGEAPEGLAQGMALSVQSRA